MRRAIHIVIGLLLIIAGLGVGILTETWWIAWLVGAPLAFFGVLALVETISPDLMTLKEERRQLQAWENFRDAIQYASAEYDDADNADDGGNCSNDSADCENPSAKSLTSIATGKSLDLAFFRNAKGISVRDDHPIRLKKRKNAVDIIWRASAAIDNVLAHCRFILEKIKSSVINDIFKICTPKKKLFDSHDDGLSGF